MLTEYYHRPKATQDAFLEGWYLTGDYGYMLDGEVYITGRKKDLIIVGGKNIYPQDIERIGMTVRVSIPAGQSPSVSSPRKPARKKSFWWPKWIRTTR